MNFSGYNKIFSVEVDDEIIRLREIQVCTTRDKLKKIGKFFLDTADLIDHWGDDFDDSHLKLEVEEFDDWDEPDIVLIRKASEAL